MIDARHKWNRMFSPVWIGGAISLLCIILAYFVARGTLLSDDMQEGAIVLLACIGALSQLIFFMHLGIEEKPRWNLLIFFFMLLIIAILVGGSLWIMANLKYNVMNL